MKEMWNSKYGTDDFFYGKEPNAFFKDQLAQLKPGTIFFPAEGEGRNAVYAATKGWNVDAVDSSEEAFRKATLLSLENDCDINYVIRDIFEHHIPEKHYDAAVWCFLHLPDPLRKAYLGRVINGLKSGGKLIFESFSKKQLGRTSGGPKNYDLLYNLEDVLADLTEMEIEIGEQTETHLDEGTGHHGDGIVIRIVATKK